MRATAHTEHHGAEEQVPLMGRQGAVQHARARGARGTAEELEIESRLGPFERHDLTARE